MGTKASRESHVLLHARAKRATRGTRVERATKGTKASRESQVLWQAREKRMGSGQCTSKEGVRETEY